MVGVQRRVYVGTELRLLPAGVPSVFFLSHDILRLHSSRPYQGDI